LGRGFNLINEGKMKKQIKNLDSCYYLDSYKNLKIRKGKIKISGNSFIAVNQESEIILESRLPLLKGCSYSILTNPHFLEENEVSDDFFEVLKKYNHKEAQRLDAYLERKKLLENEKLEKIKYIVLE
tara:strand:- start:4323 stop:4703 length:381 start_codon:yes stop_codon:yes gene_type:complete